MRTMICILIFGMVVCSCNKKEEAFNLDSDVEISVKDGLGNDLLNPSTPNAFAENQIKIFYLIDGEKQEVYYPNYTYPRNFCFREYDGNYRMVLFLNSSEKEEYPVTYVQWNEMDTDTISGTFTRGEGSVICRKVWFNGTLVWGGYPDPRFFEIVK